MTKGGYLLVALVAALLVANAGAATIDSVRGSGTFTNNGYDRNSPLYGVQAKVSVDATSGANGENASGRMSVQLTSKGAPAKSLQVNVDCIDISWAGNLGWVSHHAIVGGTVRNKDNGGYRFVMFHVLTNADGGGVDWAGVWAYQELSVHPITGIRAANACDQAENYTGEAGSFSVLSKGGFTITDS